MRPEEIVRRIRESRREDFFRRVRGVSWALVFTALIGWIVYGLLTQ